MFFSGLVWLIRGLRILLMEALIISIIGNATLLFQRRLLLPLTSSSGPLDNFVELSLCTFRSWRLRLVLRYYFGVFFVFVINICIRLLLNIFTGNPLRRWLRFRMLTPLRRWRTLPFFIRKLFDPTSATSSQNSTLRGQRREIISIVKITIIIPVFMHPSIPSILGTALVLTLKNYFILYSRLPVILFMLALAIRSIMFFSLEPWGLTIFFISIVCRKCALMNILIWSSWTILLSIMPWVLLLIGIPIVLEHPIWNSFGALLSTRIAMLVFLHSLLSAADLRPILSC